MPGCYVDEFEAFEAFADDGFLEVGESLDLFVDKVDEFVFGHAILGVVGRCGRESEEQVDIAVVGLGVGEPVLRDCGFFSPAGVVDEEVSRGLCEVGGEFAVGRVVPGPDGLGDFEEGFGGDVGGRDCGVSSA